MITIKKVVGVCVGLILVLVCFVVAGVVLFTLLRKNQFDDVPKLRLESPMKAALSLYGSQARRRCLAIFPRLPSTVFSSRTELSISIVGVEGAVHGITFWAREWEDSARTFVHTG